MYTIELVKVPNQEFSINVEGNVFSIRLRTFRGITFASVSMNGELLTGGVKCMPNSSIFGGNVNTKLKGTLSFKCLTDNFPHYENFDGISCVLTYTPFEGA